MIEQLKKSWFFFSYFKDYPSVAKKNNVVGYRCVNPLQRWWGEILCFTHQNLLHYWHVLDNINIFCSKIKKKPKSKDYIHLLYIIYMIIITRGDVLPERRVYTQIQGVAAHNDFFWRRYGLFLVEKKWCFCSRIISLINQTPFRNIKYEKPVYICFFFFCCTSSRKNLHKKILAP